MKDAQTAAASAASLRVVVDDVARIPCDPAPLPVWTPPDRPAEADYQLFGKLQTDRLLVCDGKRRMAVAAGDFFNVQADWYQSQIKPRYWWQRVPKAKPIETTIDEILAKTP